MQAGTFFRDSALGRYRNKPVEPSKRQVQLATGMLGWSGGGLEGEDHRHGLWDQRGEAMLTASFNRMAAVILLVTSLASWFSYHVARNLVLHKQEAQLEQSLLLTKRSITTEIDRFRSLPAIVGEDARVRALATDTSRGAIDAANAYLERIVKQTGPADLYVLNAAGLTLAASNHATPQSFVGHDYSFRPYFRDALFTGNGRFYAIGVTTRKPGYFLSSRIDIAGAQPVVVVVKADLSPLEAAWAAAGVRIAIADRAGVVFLSGDPDWKYRPLQPLADQMLERLLQERTYDGVDLARAEPISSTLDASRPADTSVIMPGADRRLMAKFAPLQPDDWQIVAAADVRQVDMIGALWAFAVFAAGLTTGAIFYVLRQRRQLVRMRLRQGELLERMVAERTHDLACEIDMRKRTDIQAGHIHQDRDKARQDAGDEQLSDILLGDIAVDRQNHRRWDEDAERAAAGDHACGQFVGIAEAPHFRQRDLAHSRGRCD